jgi:hypothetical protein
MPESVESAKFVLEITRGISNEEMANKFGMTRYALRRRILRAREIIGTPQGLQGTDAVMDLRGLLNAPKSEYTDKTKTPEFRTHTARILFWDLETSTIDLNIRQYDLRSHKGYHHYKTIKRDWHILGGAWKFMGEDVKCISVSSIDPLNDEAVVRRLHEILQQADILVAHNGDAFDIKKFNARALYYGLPPILNKHSIDTLKEARKGFRITSNALGYLGQFLKIEDAKLDSPDWNKVLDGDANELAVMREYNRMDVILLEKVYYKLLGWMKSHPNLNAYNKIKDVAGNEVQVCKNCGSPNLRKLDKPYYLKASGRRQDQFSCDDCGHVSLGIIKRRKNG